MLQRPHNRTQDFIVATYQARVEVHSESLPGPDYCSVTYTITEHKPGDMAEYPAIHDGLARKIATKVLDETQALFLENTQRFIRPAAVQSIGSVYVTERDVVELTAKHEKTDEYTETIDSWLNPRHT